MFMYCSFQCQMPMRSRVEANKRKEAKQERKEAKAEICCSFYNPMYEDSTLDNDSLKCKNKKLQIGSEPEQSKNV